MPVPRNPVVSTKLFVGLILAMLVCLSPRRRAREKMCPRDADEMGPAKLSYQEDGKGHWCDNEHFQITKTVMCNIFSFHCCWKFHFQSPSYLTVHGNFISTFFPILFCFMLVFILEKHVKTSLSGVKLCQSCTFALS